jgi:hypothetical protein
MAGNMKRSSIEFGWVTKGGKHVEGLHILGNVIRNNRK